MILALMTAVATAQAPAPEASESSSGTSLAMYVSFLEPSVSAGGGGVFISPLNATVRAGAILSGQHALLIGLSLGASFLSTTNGFTLVFMPTYRYHFKPLVAGVFSPFVQAEVFVGWSTSTGGGSTANSVPFGLGGGVGAEYLVTKNFGVMAGAGLRFVHAETSFTGGGGGAHYNAIGLYATAALALHF